MAYQTLYRQPRALEGFGDLPLVLGSDRLRLVAGPVTLDLLGAFLLNDSGELLGGAVHGVELSDGSNGGLQYTLSGLQLEVVELLAYATWEGEVLPYFLLSGADTVLGSAGHDELVGYYGADLLIGGTGDDIYVVDWFDQVVELPGEGDDAVLAEASYTLPDHVEQLWLLGDWMYDATGNEQDNLLVGNTARNRIDGRGGNDTLAGAGGNDTLFGGAGNDTYLIDHHNALVVELPGAGRDLVVATVSVTLADFVEDLELDDEAPIDGTGNAMANRLTGNAAANRLDGAGGNDTMDGAAGDDTYVIDSTGDVVVDISGSDTLEYRIDALGPLLAGFENLRLAGTAVVGTGNAGANLLEGNGIDNLLRGLDGDDTLWGGMLYGPGGGTDTLQGGAGNDTYLLEDLQDVVQEFPGEGYDTILANGRGGVLPDHVEALIVVPGTSGLVGLTGNAQDNRLVAGPYDDSLDGRGGIDTLEGGGGNDRYMVDDPLDQVIDSSGFVDVIHTTVGFDMALAPGVENLRVFSEGAVTVHGNALPNFIIGGVGDNLLVAVGGDTLWGWDGSDFLLGSEQADELEGGPGNDTMVGGGGDDTYLAYSPGDVITELPGGGTDTLHVNSAMAMLPNIERMILGYHAHAGWGTEAGGQWLHATNGAELHGGGGDDDSLQGGLLSDGLHDDGARAWMAGAGGDDSYYVTGLDDTLVEFASDGTDTVFTLQDFTLAAHFEDLVLTQGARGWGNDADNRLTGNAGANTLDGATGIDTLTGGAGDDVYLLDNPHDLVQEAAGEGMDTALAHGAGHFLMAPGVEVLWLESAAGEVAGATGNALGNAIRGTAGGNALDGGLGADTLEGLGGDDTYTVDQSGDVLLEPAQQGVDTVRSALAAFTLGQHFENLVLLAPASDGTGNDADNTLQGNAVANRLDGAAGNDVLSGGEGHDSLTGGPGNDAINGEAGFDTALYSGSRAAYTVVRGAGQVTVTGAEGSDVLVGIEQLRFADQDAVLNAHPATGNISVTGDLIETRTVAAVISGLSDGDGLGALAYQWFRGDVAIAGATATSYTLMEADIGEAIRLRVAFADGSGNAEILWSMPGAPVVPLDRTAPQLEGMVPGYWQQDVAVDSLLVLDFDEAVRRGQGLITLMNGDGVLEVFDAATSTRLVYAGQTLTIDPTQPLPHGHQVRLQVSAGAVVDLEGNAYVGWGASDTSTAFFTVAAPDTEGPDLIGREPSGWGDQGLFAMYLRFDEPILRGSGNVVLRAAGGEIVETFDIANSASTTLDGYILELQRTVLLDAGHRYVLEVPTGLVKDSAGNFQVAGASYAFTSGPRLAHVPGPDHVIAGWATLDSVMGGDGNDSLRGGGEDDLLDGGEGFDVALFSGLRGQYRITGELAAPMVADLTAGRDGADTLQGVEMLHFSDRSVDLLLLNRAMGVGMDRLTRLEELYVGFFNRIPEAQGMRHWVNEMHMGYNLEHVADQFYSAGVAFGLYGADWSQARFIAEIYANVLGRPAGSDHAPTQGEIDYWDGLLTSGAFTKGGMVFKMLDDVHDWFTGHPVVGFVARHLDNKAAVAHLYAVQFGLGYYDPQDNIDFGRQLAALVTPDDISAAVAFMGVLPPADLV